MFVLLNFCSFPWWLAWLLPFLLGLLLGWALWAKWKSLYENKDSDSEKYTSRISGLESDLAKYKSEKGSYTSKISKLEKELKDAKNRKFASASAASSFVADTPRQPEGIDIKSLKADIGVLTEKRKELEKRVIDLTEERNAWRSKHNDITEEYQNAQKALTSTTESHAPVGDDWEAKYNHAVAESKRKEDQITAKSDEIRRLRDRYSDVDRKISNAEREATEWKIKYNVLKNGGATSDTSLQNTGLAASAVASLGAAAATSMYDNQEIDTPDQSKKDDSTVEDSKDTDITSLYQKQVDTQEVEVTDATVDDMVNISSSAASSSSVYDGIKEDNLQIIEGIGPKMESVLKENGIETLELMAAKETADMQAILDKYEDKYRIIDPSSWVEQARYARDRNWEKLIAFQKDLNASAEQGEQAVSDSKLEKYLIKTGALKRWTQDDLKAIEGVGPAIEKILHDGGIMTWRALADTSVERLKSLLEEAGSRFKLADPTTWPRQAELAADGMFDELQVYQDELTGGRI